MCAFCSSFYDISRNSFTGVLRDIPLDLPTVHHLDQFSLLLFGQGCLLPGHGSAPFAQAVLYAIMDTFYSVVDLSSLRCLLKQRIAMIVVTGSEYGKRKGKGMQEQVKQQHIPVKIYRTDERLMIAVPMAGLEPENILVEVTNESRLILHGEQRAMLKEVKELLVDEWSVGFYHRELSQSLSMQRVPTSPTAMVC